MKKLAGLAPALLILVFSAAVLADTVRLKDGSIIKGKIVSFAGGTFTVTIGEGSRRRELKFTASEVDSISFDTVAEVPPVTGSTTKTASYNGTVIRTQSPGPAPAPVKTAPAPVTKADPVTPAGNSSDRVQPIRWNVKVTADNTANGWTNSGWVVRKGQRIRVTADEGTVSLGRGQTSTASGNASLDDPLKLLKHVPTGALIAVIGDDNNDFIYIGAEREFTATRDGALFLGINEGNLNDNSGAFNVKVEIIP